MKVFTKGRNGKHQGLFDDIGELCTDPDNPHWVASRQPKPKRKPRVSGVRGISLVVFTPSSLRKRAVMRGKSLQQHLWRYRQQAGRQNQQPRFARDRMSKQRARAQGDHSPNAKAVTITGKVIATTSPCLRKCIQLSYGRNAKELEGFNLAPCSWCEELGYTLPLYGQPWQHDSEQSRKLHSLSPPDCVGAQRLLRAFSHASQLSDSAKEVCAKLLKQTLK